MANEVGRRTYGNGNSNQGSGTSLATIQSTVQSRINEIADSFPNGNSDRVKKQLYNVIIAAIFKNRDLQKCEPSSFVVAAKQAGDLGLSLEPTYGECYLVPRYNSNINGQECCLQVGYLGLVKLTRNTNQIVSIRAELVLEGDEFEYEYSPDLVFSHRPMMKYDGPNDDGKGVQAVYAYAKLANGERIIEVMSVSEVERIRRTSKTPNAGPWKEHWGQMAKKTVLRRMIKMLPKGDGGATETLAQALELHDNEYEQNALPSRGSNGSGYGSGAYCSPKDAEEYKSRLKKFIDARNEKWKKQWSDPDTGEYLPGAANLTNPWQTDIAIVRALVEDGYLDKKIIPENLKARQIGLYSGVCWNRSQDEKDLIKNVLKTFIDGREKVQLEEIKAANPHLFAPEDPEDFSDYEGVEDIEPSNAVTPVSPRPETLTSDNEEGDEE